MTQPQADELIKFLEKLSKGYLPLDQIARSDKVGNLGRMQRFYENKAVLAPEAQSEMFRSFAAALLYAMSVINLYDNLTKNLAVVVKDEESQ